jgi:hypothetical protein
MARPPKLSSVVTEFSRAIHSARNLYAAVEPFLPRTYDGMQGDSLHPEQARRVVGLAFLSMTSAWEEFVESCFIRYMAGAASDSGYGPTLRLGACPSLVHACKIIRGPHFNPKKEFISWTSVPLVVDRAKLYFANGEPFHVLPSREQALGDGFRIRNRVAHRSRKAKGDFKDAALRILRRPTANQGGRLRQAYSVGELLVHETRRFYGRRGRRRTVFEWFARTYRRLAKQIAPSET